MESKRNIIKWYKLVIFYVIDLINVGGIMAS